MLLPLWLQFLQFEKYIWKSLFVYLEFSGRTSATSVSNCRSLRTSEKMLSWSKPWMLRIFVMEIYDDIAEFTYRDGEEWIIRDLSSLAARGDHE